MDPTDSEVEGLERTIDELEAKKTEVTEKFSEIYATCPEASDGGTPSGFTTIREARINVEKYGKEIDEAIKRAEDRVALLKKKKSEYVKLQAHWDHTEQFVQRAIEALRTRQREGKIPEDLADLAVGHLVEASGIKEA